jgi:hypothetical protein
MYNSLRLLFAFDKRRAHFALDESDNFFCHGEKAVFAGGFAKMCVFNVVFLW